MKSVVALSILILFLSSCRCEKVSCPGFDAKLRNYLPADSTLRYVNDNGDEIIFFMDSTGQTLGGVREPIYGVEVCDDNRCEEYAYFAASSNVLIDSTSDMRIWISAPVYKTSGLKPSKATANIELFSFRSDFTYYPVVQTNTYGTSYYDSLQLGNRIYRQVIVLGWDTIKLKTTPDSLQPIISQVYLTPQQGIIGFNNWKERTTYYLQ